MAYKMNGFSGFKNSPLKQDISSVLDPESGRPWTTHKRVTKPKRVNVTTGFGPEADKKMTSLVNKRTSVSKVSKKPVSKLGGFAKKAQKLWKPFGPGTRPLHPSVTKGLKTLGKRVGVVGAITGAYDVFKGYGKLAKTKHGKQIIKDARMMPGKI